VVVFLIASERVRHDAISGCLATRPVTRRPKPPLEKFSPLLEECVAHGLKILDIVQKIWTPLGKLFAPPGVLRWLRACLLPFHNYWRLSEKKIISIKFEKILLEKSPVTPRADPTRKVGGGVFR